MTNKIENGTNCINETNLLKWISDELYLRLEYRIITGKKLHLNPPMKFNETIKNQRDPEKGNPLIFFVENIQIKEPESIDYRVLIGLISQS